MTLERLLESSAEELERLSDAEIEALFAPIFNVVRPTGKPPVTKQVTPKPQKVPTIMKGYTPEQLERIKRLEEKSGIKLL